MKTFAFRLLLAGALSFSVSLRAQDTFSIVAVDTLTGEVGSAGASCVDLLLFFPNYPIDFLGDLIPGQGAINTQASYNATNQVNARNRMLAGDTPQQIINWLVANDVGGSPASRQYGIASLVNGSAQTAGYTGANTLNYKNHIAGPTYCIQGNILLGQSILDSMEARFLRAEGDLACKLMEALQGAKVPGADTRCATNGSGTSSLFAFLEVAQPTDPYGSPSLLLGVKTPGGFGIEPIDSLQTLFDAQRSCTTAGTNETTFLNPWTIFPNPAGDMLNIDQRSSSAAATYRFLDIRGRRVAGGNIDAWPAQISLSGIPQGSYIIELRGAPGTYRQQLMKR